MASTYRHMVSSFFSISGRTRRRRFVVELLPLAVFFLPAIGHAVAQNPLTPEASEVLIALIGLGVVLALPLAFFPAVRRLHDAGVPGYALFMLIVPMANVLLLLTLFLKRGTRGENRYGPPPA